MKSLHGLKQTPKNWRDRLSNLLFKNGFERGQVNTKYFIMILFDLRYRFMSLTKVLY